MTAVRIEGRKVRYAVVGAGWISQAAFMPGVAGCGADAPGEASVAGAGDELARDQTATAGQCGGGGRRVSCGGR